MKIGLNKSEMVSNGESFSCYMNPMVHIVNPNKFEIEVNLIDCTHSSLNGSLIF